MLEYKIIINFYKKKKKREREKLNTNRELTRF